MESENSGVELKKLSEENLSCQPEEVFDIICKLGEGSYGSVYKALHKDSGNVLAIKQVPVDSDLQEIIKEISIMQQCDSTYVVKYYGSYFKNSDLWIVMEYCGAGSVSDIIKLRKKTLTESEIATILSDTLKGLQYLHLRLKIHRDIKAGNILLNNHGVAKLADFGVAGQLTDTMAKRNTVIGTPFWMAPEVIQEIGHDCMADMWSLGITALEMAEGRPPYCDIHPMRVIFMIPTMPPPSFRDINHWSKPFVDFVQSCLHKNPEDRCSASQLLTHNFILSAQPAAKTLTQCIAEAAECRKNLQASRLKSVHIPPAVASLLPATTSQSGEQPPRVQSGDTTSSPSQHGSATTAGGDTVVSEHCDAVTHDMDGTLVSSPGSSLNTMLINSDSDNGQADDTTLKDGEIPRSKYRPQFLSHFDQKEADKNQCMENRKNLVVSNLLNEIGEKVYVLSAENLSPRRSTCLLDMSLESMQYMTASQIKVRINNLDSQMEREIDQLRQLYVSKRKPILEAIETKHKQYKENGLGF